jgi:Ca2+-binding EF-hand superfamily protein
VRHALASAFLLVTAASCGAAAADGALSRAEAEQRSPRLARHFDAIDANGDGRITALEIRAWRKGRRGADRGRGRFDELFRRADADGDGALSRDEAAKSLPRVARKFDRIDADGDGRLTLEEMHAWLDARRARTVKASGSAR